MKFFIFSILFGGTVVLIAIALPLCGLHIPITNPIDSALGLAEVASALVQLTVELNAISVAVKAFAAIAPAAPDILFSSVAGSEKELNDLTSAINDIGISLSEVSTAVLSIRQQPGKDDDTTLYRDLHGVATNFNAISSTLSTLTLSVTSVQDVSEFTAASDELRKILIKVFNNTVAIKGAVNDGVAAINIFAANEGKKYVGWFKATTTASGVAAAYSAFSSAVSDMSKALATKISRTGSADVSVTAFVAAFDKLSVDLKGLATAVENV